MSSRYGSQKLLPLPFAQVTQALFLLDRVGRHQRRHLVGAVLG
jgi:hypothetical protein